jgi:hypothetical protein
MHPAVRIFAVVALVLFGVAACASSSSGGDTKWRFASVHTGQQSGKKHAR